MKALFIHQNFPAQYLHLARYLQAHGHEVVGLGEADNIKRRGTIKGVTTAGYPKPQGAGKSTHFYLRAAEAAVRRGQAAARALLALQKKGFEPDVICVHPGWGEGLFVKSVYPSVPLVMFCEFYFQPGEADIGFDPEFPVKEDSRFNIYTRNAQQDLSLPRADHLVCPSRWQASRYPECFRRDIRILHEGVNTVFMCPDPDDSLTLWPHPDPGHNYVVPKGGEGIAPDAAPITLTRRDKVITYVARNLEPYRGFHVLMRALPELQRRHPDAHIVLAGGDGVSYGQHLPTGYTYKKRFLNEVRDSIDLTRVHFLGLVPYETLRTIFRISSAHVYLTYPFVLSWSATESMACEGLLIASDTEPVREVVTHGKDGILVDFFDRDALVNAVSDALDRPQEYLGIRKAARERILADFNVTECVARQAAFLQEIGR